MFFFWKDINLMQLATDYGLLISNGCNGGINSKSFMKCVFCNSYYDLECANVAKSAYTLMKQIHKDSWKCPACRNEERKVGNVNTPVRSAKQQQETPLGPSSQADVDSNVTVRRGATSAPMPTAPGNKAEEDSALNPENLRLLIKREIKKAVSESVGRLIKEQLQSMTQLLGGFQSSLSSIDTQLESLKSTINEKTNTINALKTENGQLRESVHRLEEHIRQAEQQSLSNDVDIVGVPEATGEAVMHVVLTLARKLGVNLSEGDVVSAERVGAARDGLPGRVNARPIAVRLTRRALRDDLLRAARVRRGVTTADAGLSGESRRFYINERLTRENRQLFLRARELGAQLKWRFVWSKDGRLYARQHQSEDSPRHRLRSEADLQRVFGAAAVGSLEGKSAP